MPTNPTAPAPLSRAEREALAGEILGAPVSFPASPALRSSVTGTLVDESLSTFTVRLASSSRTVRVPKAGLEGTIVLPSGELPLRGETLRVRPEDRTKRLLSGGSRRFR
ncbi:MAG TPA: ribonuclease P protein subunit [Thermoplasmata archaeon]|nr:ribonuclease P protein subunit [Thermoplasmata archaeon]HYB77493.1 ribonuclease P protein subunit [Thermoplasmata archaeon]